MSSSSIHHSLIQHTFCFKNSKSDLSINIQNHYSEHIWPNLGENIIAMDKEE
jgi:hypothetical protein